MCKLGHLAEDYVERDPYGVATYGDASVLPPNAQCAIWAGLRQLRDPWFLTNEDDRGSFRDLANPKYSQNHSRTPQRLGNRSSSENRRARSDCKQHREHRSGRDFTRHGVGKTRQHMA